MLVLIDLKGGRKLLPPVRGADLRRPAQKDGSIKDTACK